jgi:hypothetical protein
VTGPIGRTNGGIVAVHVGIVKPTYESVEKHEISGFSGPMDTVRDFSIKIQGRPAVITFKFHGRRTKMIPNACCDGP